MSTPEITVYSLAFNIDPVDENPYLVPLFDPCELGMVDKDIYSWFKVYENPFVDYSGDCTRVHTAFDFNNDKKIRY